MVCMMRLIRAYGSHLILYLPKPDDLYEPYFSAVADCYAIYTATIKPFSILILEL